MVDTFKAYKTSQKRARKKIKSAIRGGKEGHRKMFWGATASFRDHTQGKKEMGKGSGGWYKRGVRYFKKISGA